MKRVVWQIDVDRDTPIAAALEAKRIQRDVESTALGFDVIDEEGNQTRVDLYENTATILRRQL